MIIGFKMKLYEVMAEEYKKDKLKNRFSSGLIV